MNRLSEMWPTTTQRLLLVLGLWFTFGNYVAGTLIWPGTITDPNAMHMNHLLGFVPVMVNGWHLYFHLATGLACLVMAANLRLAVFGALAICAVYVVTGATGLTVRGDVYGLLMSDTFGNWVHVVEGVLLLATASTALPWRRFQSRTPSSPGSGLPGQTH